MVLFWVEGWSETGFGFVFEESKKKNGAAVDGPRRHALG
jgi:hypothetical protein